MAYSINKLAKLSGISTRTLRYYDEIGLLSPARISNGYRIYEQREVDLLQQILFYRALGVSLEEIARILHAPAYDRETALAEHLDALLRQRAQLDLLIGNVTKTIRSLKGEITMKDNEKFEGFKQKLVDENEAKYGEEARKKYGGTSVDASNRKLKGMTEEQWQGVQALEAQFSAALKEAIAVGDPAGAAAQRACDLHRQWLCFFWKDGSYTKQAHRGMAQMYCEDERFRAHYEAIAPGAAEFLRDAIEHYCAA